MARRIESIKSYVVTSTGVKVIEEETIPDYIDDEEVSGSYITVETTQARNALPDEVREEGMLVNVSENDSLYKLTGGIDNTDWILFSAGSPGSISLDDLSDVTLTGSPYGEGRVLVSNGTDRYVDRSDYALPGNTVFVEDGITALEGKFYPTIKEAVDWANANASKPTEIVIRSGEYQVDDKIVVNNASIKQITGTGTGSTVVVPTSSLANKATTTDRRTFQLNTSCNIVNLSIVSNSAGYRLTSGCVGIYVNANNSDIKIQNVSIKNTYNSIVTSGYTNPGDVQIVFLINSQTQNNGSHSIIVNNGSELLAEASILGTVPDGSYRLVIQNNAAKSTPTRADILGLTFRTPPSMTASGNGVLVEDDGVLELYASELINLSDAITGRNISKSEFNTVSTEALTGNTIVQRDTAIVRFVTGSGKFGINNTDVENPENLYVNAFDTEILSQVIGNESDLSNNIFTILAGFNGQNPKLTYDLGTGGLIEFDGLVYREERVGNGGSFNVLVEDGESKLLSTTKDADSKTSLRLYYSDTDDFSNITEGWDIVKEETSHDLSISYNTTNLSIYANASNQNVGIKENAPQRALHVTDTFRLEPRATPPSNPSGGDIYYDSTDGRFYGWDNQTNQWKRFYN